MNPKAVRDFFYREEVPFSLALLRILLPLVLLVVIVPRWVHSRELYSTDGAAAPLAVNYGFDNFLPEPNGTVAVALMTVLLVSLITSALGWWTRTSLLISAVLFGYLNLLDCLSSITKYSVISTHLMVLLGVSRCGALWSIDAWLKSSDLPTRRLLGITTSLPIAAVWPQRLMQLLIGLIYFGAATTKLQTEAYFTSDQLRWWMMTDVNRTNPLGEWLSLYPGILIAMAHAAIVWQIVFVFICWRGIGRLIALGFGATFHLSTAPLLGLYVFPMVMISSYVVFFSEQDALRLLRWMKWLRRSMDFQSVPSKYRDEHGLEAHATPSRIRRPGLRWATSSLAYVVVLSVTTAVGVAAEFMIDPYGERRAVGKHSLPLLEPGFMEQVPKHAEDLREGDKFHTLTIGTEMLGRVMLNSRSQFKRGERLWAQVSLTLLHGDQWIECNLHDKDGLLFERNGQLVTRDRLRAEWRYTIPQDIAAGQYWIVLRSGTEEIARRQLTIE